MDKFRCLIPDDLMDGLGELLVEPRSHISPLNSTESQAYTPAQIGVLQTLGWVDESGRPTQPALPVLRVFSRTKSFAKLHFNSGGQGLSYVIYFSDQEDPDISLVATQQGVELISPSNVQDVLQGVKEYTGESLLRSCDLELEISLLEGIVFAALLDLQRKSILQSFLSSAELLAQAFDESQLASAIAEMPDSPQWLTPVVKTLAGIERPLSSAEIREALFSLARQGAIVQNNNTFSLAEVAAKAADRLLLFDNFITLTAGREDRDGRVSLTGFTCLQAGVNDLLYIEACGSQLLLRFVSASMLHGHLRFFLTNANALQDLQESSPAMSSAPVRVVPPQVQSAPIPSACHACHQPLRDGDQFCAHCGTAVVSETPNEQQLCPQCGQATTPGAKFCGHCGYALGAHS